MTYGSTARSFFDLDPYYPLFHPPSTPSSLRSSFELDNSARTSPTPPSSPLDLTDLCSIPPDVWKNTTLVSTPPSTAPHSPPLYTRFEPHPDDLFNPTLVKKEAGKEAVGHCRLCKDEDGIKLTTADEGTAWFGWSEAQYTSHLLYKHGISPEFCTAYPAPSHTRPSILSPPICASKLDDAFCRSCSCWVLGSIAWDFSEPYSTDKWVGNFQVLHTHSRACYTTPPPHSTLPFPTAPASTPYPPPSALYPLPDCYFPSVTDLPLLPSLLLPTMSNPKSISLLPHLDLPDSLPLAAAPSFASHLVPSPVSTTLGSPFPSLPPTCISTPVSGFASGLAAAEEGQGEVKVPSPAGTRRSLRVLTPKVSTDTLNGSEALTALSGAEAPGGSSGGRGGGEKRKRSTRSGLLRSKSTGYYDDDGGSDGDSGDGNNGSRSRKRLRMMR